MERFCEVCHGLGDHLPECPYYEPKPVCTCELCGDLIYSGETIFKVDGITYHEECFVNEYRTEA